MSNPAVVKLQVEKIEGQRVWLDDNFGESIHLHIDDIRIDLTNEEFSNMCDDICAAINELVNVEGFDCNKINPVYLKVMLWDRLTHLRKVKIENVKLSEMIAPGNNRVARLPDSRGVKALNGNTKENDVIRASHHMGQTSQDRLQKVYDSIEKNGYPYNSEYIIMYGDDNVIRDGQHRAACLYKIHGDISVPVMRLYFDDYVLEKIDDIKSGNKFWVRAKYNIDKLVSRVYNSGGITTSLKKAIRKSKSLIKRKLLKMYLWKNRTRIQEVEKVFDNK